MSGYTPLFDTMLSGTLYGRWPHTGIWACLLSRVSRDGEIDETPQSLASAIGVPVDTLMQCIKDFMEPDTESRTNEHDGRRLALIDTRRSWGWRVLNHGKYREKARKKNYDERRTESGQDAQRKQASRDVPRCPAMSRDVPLSTPTPTPTPTPTHTHTDARVSEAEQHQGFQTLKAAYPKFAGRQDWMQAEMYCRNRLDDGETWLTLMAAVERFAAYCRAIGREGTNFVMSPGKFFSAADEPWKQPWDLPAKLNGGKSISQMIDEACDRE